MVRRLGNKNMKRGEDDKKERKYEHGEENKRRWNGGKGI